MINRVRRTNGRSQRMGSTWTHLVSQAGDTCTVALSGELEMSGREELIRLLVDTVNTPGVAAVEVDLDAVHFMDSSGMAALMAAHHIAEVSDRRLTVVRTRGHVRRALEVAGILPILWAGSSSAGSTADR
jgi:anti-anti-sigma factor